MTTRVAFYLRQSVARDGETVETSTSLESQEGALRQRGRQDGWMVVESIRDHDLKGDDPNRDGIRRLMELAAAKRIDAVAVFAISRFAREHVWQEIAYRQLRAYGVSVISLTEPNLDHTLFRGVLGVVNQYASEQTSQFLKQAIKTRITRGYTHGTPPLGYLRPDPHQPLQPDPLTDDVPARLFALFAHDQMGMPAIAALFTQERVAGRTWSTTQVRRILHCRAYLGEAVAGDTATPGAHPALVPRELWDAAHALIGRHGRTSPRGASSWLKGLVVCGCGRACFLRADATLKTGYVNCARFVCGSRAPRNMVVAPCDQPVKSLALHILEERVARELVDVLTGYDGWEAGYRAALARHTRSAPSADRERARIARQIDALDRERDALLRKSNKGLLDDERWAEEDRRLGTEIAAKTAALAALPTPPDRARFEAIGGVVVDLARDIELVAHDQPEVLRRVVLRLGASACIVAPHLILPADLADVVGRSNR